MPPLPDRVLSHLRELAATEPRAEAAGEPTDVHFVTPLTVVAGRFDVIDRLGEGGMGTVYRAHDRAAGRRVAIKILHHGDAAAEQRFDREIRALAALAHPGIVGYVAHGGAAGGDPPFVAMDLLEGEDLGARLARGPLGVAETIQLGLHLASALSAAHAIGIVHRDVKPENVILSRDGVKLVDFGLARRVDDRAPITREGYAAGTLGYMAPEQARGDRDVDARADVFALGCLLHDALAGLERPRGVRDLLAPRRPLREAHPDAPEALEAILLEMLAPSAAVRLPHAGAVLARLRALSRFSSFDVLRPESSGGWMARAFGRRTTLHGRELERRWLTDRIATSGFGCLIVGEAGVGKTRLALEVAGDAFTLVAADPMRASEPLAFASRLVDAMSGPSSGDRSALVAWLTSAWARAPWSLLLDDLDGADAASIDVLAEALLGVGPARPRIVALARGAIIGRHRGIAARLGLIPVGLRGLDPVAIRAMAVELGDAAAATTRGFETPLHLEEALRAAELAIASPSPDTAEARLTARIAALSPYPRWALLAASLFAGPFTEPELARVLGQHDPEAARRALIELALFDFVGPVEGGLFRVRSRLAAEIARGLAPPSDVALGRQIVARVLDARSAAPLHA